MCFSCTNKDKIIYFNFITKFKTLNFNPIYTTEKNGQARINFGKGKILFHQSKDEFGSVNCHYLADDFRVSGQRPDVVLFQKNNCQGKAVESTLANIHPCLAVFSAM